MYMYSTQVHNTQCICNSKCTAYRFRDIGVEMLSGSLSTSLPEIFSSKSDSSVIGSTNVSTMKELKELLNGDDLHKNVMYNIHVHVCAVAVGS